MANTKSQRQSVQWVGRRCCAAGYDGRTAARPCRLEYVPIIIGKWYDSQIAATARRLLLAALSWVAVAGWAGAADSLAGSNTPAFGDITFFVGSDLHYGYTLHTPTCDEISRATLGRMNLLPGQSYPATAGGGPVAAPRGVLLVGDLTDLGAGSQWSPALRSIWVTRPSATVEAFGAGECD